MNRAKYLQTDMNGTRKRASVLIRILCIVALFSFIAACSPKEARLLVGKWALSESMIGGTPSSFWFKGDGTVIGPWEHHKYAMQSQGTYEFIGDKSIKISMHAGYYKGNVYIFDIVKVDEKELILRNNYEDIRLKRSN